MAKHGTTLVTGGPGYIESHTVLALRDGGRTGVVLDNLFTGSRAAVPEDVLLIEGDYIHVADLAAAQLAALRYIENGGESRSLNWGRRFEDQEEIIASAVNWETIIPSNEMAEPYRASA